MSEANKKFAKLIDLLWDRTQEGKIPWQYDQKAKGPYVWHNDVLLSMLSSQDENYEDLFQVSLINRQGVFLDTFSDITLAEITPPDPNFADYFTKMGALYTAAQRQATGADKALDDFVKALENDEIEIPF